METVISCLFFVFKSRQIQNKHGPSAITNYLLAQANIPQYGSRVRLVRGLDFSYPPLFRGGMAAKPSGNYWRSMLPTAYNCGLLGVHFQSSRRNFGVESIRNAPWVLCQRSYNGRHLKSVLNGENRGAGAEVTFIMLLGKTDR